MRKVVVLTYTIKDKQSDNYFVDSVVNVVSGEEGHIVAKRVAEESDPFIAAFAASSVHRFIVKHILAERDKILKEGGEF
jgi:hypothetical protein